MKYILMLILLFIGLDTVSAQSRLKDEAIVAQHKRMVFESWGDWKPEPKYFLGIQTNLSYALIWGAWAPSRNRNYKRGNDLRPLSPDGEETLRQVELELQKRNAERIMHDVDSLKRIAVTDFEHYSPHIVDADPLWLLYYKRMLKPLNEFPDNPQNNTDWGITNPNIYSKMLALGDIDILQEKLNVIKERYKISRTVAMPRGKRFLMYHATLLEWRELVNMIKRFDRKSYFTNHFDVNLRKFRLVNGNNYGYRNDSQIVRNILESHNFIETENESTR